MSSATEEAEGAYGRPVIAWHGAGGELFRIFIVNLLLTVLTLGFYRFWGKTRIRRYIWSHTSFEGERLEYTGTGKELFLGFLIIVFLILVPLFAVLVGSQFYIEMNHPEVLPQFSAIQTLIILYLIPVAIYRARRYRLSRTRWRGIRGAQDGSALAYGGMTLGCYFIAVLTLGLTLPLVRTLLMRYKLKNTLFGNRRFSFEGRAGPLYKPFFGVFAAYIGIFILFIVLLTLLGGALFADQASALAATRLAAEDSEMSFGVWEFVPILFLFLFIIPWYFFRAAEYRHFAGQTRYEGLSFSSDVTGWRLCGLYLGNLFILFFTLGLGQPLVYVRTIGFLSRHLRMDGVQDFSAIVQSAIEEPSVGEGLADAFDVGEF